MPLHEAWVMEPLLYSCVAVPFIVQLLLMLRDGLEGRK